MIMVSYSISSCSSLD